MAFSTNSTLSGTVERVTFHSEDTGFSVLKVKVKGEADLVTVIGRIPNVSVGEFLTAEGDWVMDPTHGNQLKATILRTSPPDSREGIEKFLGSGLIKGIGPIYAKKLVEKFGEEVLDIIDQHSARLEEVEGIGRTRRQRIKESWNETKVVREIMTFLLSHGISTARAYRIYKTYGEQAMARVQADPYCLARDLRGIGFKTADEIAREFGIGIDSPLRARAAVEHLLNESATSGHCAVPREDLVRDGHEQLELPSDVLEQAILEGLASKRLILETAHTSTPWIYLDPLYKAETELAQDLARLNQGDPPLGDADPEKVLNWTRSQLGFELSDNQAQAIRQALHSKVLVITGGPGVGKTTLVKGLMSIFKARKLNIKLAAPTGRAAKRLSESAGAHATTLHRLLVYDPENGGFKHDRNTPLKGEVFIIDESSMLDLPLAHKLIRALPPKAVLILVGDVDQLPSVGPGSVLKDVLLSDRVPVCRLTEIFRQAADSRIVTNAHQVNQGIVPTGCSASDPGDFYILPAETPEEVWSKLRGLLSGKLRSSFHMDPKRDVQVLTPMQRGELGARTLNSRLQNLLNPSGEKVERFGSVFRVGDRVMQILNNYDKEVFNGDMGTVVALDQEEQRLWVDLGGNKVDYSFQELDELVLSYAVTIHKSQGSEYPCVLLPLHTQHYVMLQRNLLYTAITRGKQLVIVVGPAQALRMACQNADSGQRNTLLAQRIREALND